VNGGTLEQARAHALPARRLRDRDAEFGHPLLGGRAGAALLGGREGQVADADQLEYVVEHAEHDVARKIDLVHVGVDLLVRQDGAEAQQAVALVERQEMLEHAPAVALAQCLDQHRRTVGLAGQAGQPVGERIVGHTESGFG